jgi:hypothetical protein
MRTERPIDNRGPPSTPLASRRQHRRPTAKALDLTIAPLLLRADHSSEMRRPEGLEAQIYKKPRCDIDGSHWGRCSRTLTRYEIGEISTSRSKFPRLWG